MDEYTSHTIIKLKFGSEIALFIKHFDIIAQIKILS